MLLDRESTIKLHNHQLTREENCKLIFNLINSESTLTRAELVRITGLSPSTVSSLVDDLVRAELVEEVGLARMATGAGRRPIMLNVNPAGPCFRSAAGASTLNCLTWVTTYWKSVFGHAFATGTARMQIVL